MTFVRRTARSLIAPALATAVSLTALSGCSDSDADPGASPTTPTSSATETGSPSPSPTPTGPVEPTLPPAARGDDAAAAEAFVKHYFEMLNFAQTTGDTSGLKSLAMPQCAACRGSLEAIENTFDAGGSIRGGKLAVSDLRATSLDVIGEATKPFDVRASLASTKQVIRGSEDDALNGTYPPSTVALQLQVLHSPNGWVMAEWSQVS